MVNDVFSVKTRLLMSNIFMKPKKDRETGLGLFAVVDA
jgi:hypothetical protein